MGWWSNAIMGGDTSWDAAGVAAKLLGLGGQEDGDWGRYHMPEDWDDADRALMLGAINRYGGADKLLDAVLADFTRGSDVDEVCTQVVGLLVVACGAPITEQFRKRVIEACLDDPYVVDSDDRATVLEAMIGVMERYDGAAVTEEDEAAIFYGIEEQDG